MSRVTVRSVAGAAYAQEAVAGRHTLMIDEPEASGGSDRGPGPYELLLAALGS